ncbi:hypothetical protein BZA77DRAFT_108275 [Pyronema omphalodes]|nr:hypothetical protein BZA77DRAFT_108275 [Pyronema omphalodes]
MADPRRSARSTKGVNSRLSDINVVELPSPSVAKRRKSTPKQASPPVPAASNASVDGGSDDIIRCVCGANEEDEDDDRMMIQCEGCDAWQHTQCMGIPKKKIPKQYLCEVCAPDRHEFLLEQMSLGEKPWEKRGRWRAKPAAKPAETPAREKKATPAVSENGSVKATKDTKTPAKSKASEKAKATAVEKKPTAAEKKKQAAAEKKEKEREEKLRAETEEEEDEEEIEEVEKQVQKKGSIKKEPEIPATPEPEPRQEAPEATPEPNPKPLKNEPAASTSTEKPAFEDKMDIDSTEPQPPPSEDKVEKVEAAENKGPGVPSPVEDMPPPPVTNDTNDAAKKTALLPPIDTNSPVPRAKKTKKDDKQESHSKSSTPITPKSTKRKLHPSEDSDAEVKTEDKDHAEKKARRVSVVASTPESTPKPPKQQERRKSSVVTPKTVKKISKEDTTPQQELVQSTSELRNSNRQAVVEFVISSLTPHAKRIVSEKKITLKDGETVEGLCENRALHIEHHVYMKYFAGGNITPEYRQKMRSIGLNLKSNASLSDEILGGGLSPERLAQMSTEEMASKELKAFAQQVRLESEKHNTLINETGPRIRRTHKGEEIVGDESANAGQETLLESGNLIRRPSDSVMEDAPAPITPPQPGSPTQPADASMSPPITVPATSETPHSPSGAAASQGSAPPEKKDRSFSIENVWSKVESPDVERRPTPTTRVAPPLRPVETVTKVDKDIDMLLKDDDASVDGSLPYSPASYNDHYSPKADNDYADDIWRGRVEMSAIANFGATAALLGGPGQLGDKKWFELLDTSINIDGRIKHERATEYLCGQKFSKSSSMVLASLTPDHAVHQQQFDKLYDYFKSKERYAVVGKNQNPAIKDLYIVPIDAQETLPDWFNVVDPPSNVPAEKRAQKMLVLIFVVIKHMVSGYVDTGLQRRFSHALETPKQPQASPYAPGPYVPQVGLAPAQGQQGQQPFSPSPMVYGQPNQQQQQYGYPQHQQHPHQGHLPPLYPVAPGHPSQYPPHSSPPQQNQSAHLQHPLPPVHPHPPPQGYQQYPPPRTYIPKHPMTQELILNVPTINDIQIQTIDKLLEDNPNLQDRPEELAAKVGEYLSSIGQAN